MKKAVSVLLCIIMVFSCASVSFADDKTYYVQLDLGEKSPFEAFHGWGTSICWWGHHLGENLNDEQLDAVVKALYDEEEGLGLNVARYNIGGGDDPEHHHQREFDGRDMPGLTTAEGEWNLENDRGQIKALELAIKYGADIVEAFSNSPPYYMTESGCSSGNHNSGENNLPDDKFDDFAEYLAEAVLKIQNTYGIKFDTLEPFNESDTNYWGYEGWQEGCHFDVEDHSKLILLVREALNKRGLTSVGVSASDETHVWRTGENIKNVYTKEAINALSQVNTHSYNSGGYDHTKNAVLEVNKPLYMTEVDGDGSIGGENSGNMGPALWFSNKINEDLRGLEPNAWVMWQAAAMAYEGEHKDSGYWNICSVDSKTGKVNKTKKYYAYKQFTKFIRPGDTLVKTDYNNIVAAVNEAEGKIVYVITNTDSAEKNYDFRLANIIGGARVNCEYYVTDKNNDCVLAVSSENVQGAFNVTAPAYSVSTVVIDTPAFKNSINVSEKDNTVTAFTGDKIELVLKSSDKNVLPAIREITLTEQGKFGYSVRFSENDEQYGIYNINVVSAGSKVRIIGSGSERALRVLGNDVVIADRTNDASQIWTLEKHGEHYAFKNEKTGWYLSTESFLTTDDKLTDKELWTLEKDKGLFRIINKATGDSIDVYNHATENGAQVGVYGGYYATANQLFYFEAAEPASELEIEYVNEGIVVKGTPFGTKPWDGDANVTFDKAWDGDAETFFHADRDADRTGYTGVDLGERHLPFNKIVLNSRPGFEYRGYEATISGSNEKDGDYDLIYTFKSEDFTRHEKATVYLDKMVDYRYIKYETPLGGYCNVGDISLVYAPDTDDAASIAYMIVSYYEEDRLVKVDVIKPEALLEDSGYEFENYDMRVKSISKENVVLGTFFIKKY